MITNVDFIFAIATMGIAAIFAIVCIRRKQILLIHQLYFGTVLIMFVWLCLVAGLRFVHSPNGTTAYVIDSLTQIGGLTAPLILMISIVFIKGIERLPRRWLLLFAVPIVMNVLVWTNPLHHLYYATFSILGNEVVFGPLIAVTAIYSYVCFAVAIVWMLRFAIKSSNRIQMYQALFFVIGDLIPIIVNLMATLRWVDMSIVITPIAYIGTVFFHGLAIFRFHMLDLKPIAMKKVLDWISDCYLVLSDANLVVSFNQPFYEIIGRYYGIKENIHLQDCMNDETMENRTVIKNLLAVIDTCRNSGVNTNASYEQVIFVKEGDGYIPHYYMVEVTPLKINEQTVGVVAIFKDVSKVKESMEKLQTSQARMMEQERLASLGHMIGGIAHNLKTPIMSIAGSANAIDDLVQECQESIGDVEVTEEDFREICTEMADWAERIREACTYMSDIITAVKGQAANMNSADDSDFTVSDLVKQVTLLLRHELLKGSCVLTVDNQTGKEIHVQGDINNMVQVMNNLVSNAIDAMKEKGGGNIDICIRQSKKTLDLIVKDTGSGVAPEIREKLFRQMITSKGVNGTGLGVFISHSVIKAKFGGSVWFEDNPGGGSVFGISVPVEYITFEESKEEQADEKE